jgi:16S rRNA (adenine1518-N6/adenine1519-N6)-dimethyltransferase
MARQRMGQHFLGDPAWQQRILASLPCNPESTWIEIGAGHGEMTRLLAPKSRRVVAIEADPPLAEGLQANVAASPDDWPSVEIVAANALDLNLAELVGEKFRVYGNLPYYITSPILHHLFEFIDRIASIHIVIQMEVAARIVSPPGNRDYGYLSTACQFYARPEIDLRLPPGAFRPPPRVTSALVSMTPPGERNRLKSEFAIPDDHAFLGFVQGCFAQKRKTLRNNLLALASDSRIRHALGACGLRPDARAEQLTLAQFGALFSWLNKSEEASETSSAGKIKAGD